MGRRIDWSGSGCEPFRSYVYFKPYSLLSFFIYLVQIINLEFFFCKNGKNLRKTSEERLKDSPKDIANSLIKIPSCFKQENNAINVFICGILPRDDLSSINRLLLKKTNNILKLSCSANHNSFINVPFITLLLVRVMNVSMFL